MITCDICGATFKTTQGLAGHKRIRHAKEQADLTLFGSQLQRKVLQHLADKVAEKLADAILEEYGEQFLQSYMGELYRQGLDLRPLGKERVSKAIIVAAGQSTRLLPLNSDRPDCLLDVGGKTILQRELDILRSCGISRIAVVRGYQKGKINYPYISYYENDDYSTTGVMKSLFCAEEEINDEFVLCYGNIIYEMGILEKLLRDRGDISLVIDTDWLSHQRPIEETVLVVVEGDRITKMGRNIISPEEAHGEFFGLAKFSRRGVEILRSNYARVTTKYSRGPFHTSPSIERALLSDMIQELIDQGYIIHNVDIQGGWVEIDSIEKLERARRLVNVN